MYLRCFLQAEDIARQRESHRKPLNLSLSCRSTDRLPMLQAGQQPLATTTSPRVGVAEKDHSKVLLQAGLFGVLFGWSSFWRAFWVVHSERLAGGSPPTPKGLALDHAPCPQPAPSRQREESRLSHPELSKDVARDLAYFSSEERLKDRWAWERRSQEAVSDHHGCGALALMTRPGWLGSRCRGFALCYCFCTGRGGLSSFFSKWK